MRRNEKIQCPRCGASRYVRVGRKTDLCMACRTPVRQPKASDALTDGVWLKRGLTWVFVADPRCYCGELLREPSCHTCVVWAERNAVLTSWIPTEFYTAEYVSEVAA